MDYKTIQQFIPIEMKKGLWGKKKKVQRFQIFKYKFSKRRHQNDEKQQSYQQRDLSLSTLEKWPKQPRALGNFSQDDPCLLKHP